MPVGTNSVTGRRRVGASADGVEDAGDGVGVPTDKAYFYPEGVEGLFEIYFAPADTFETVNTLGVPLYARMIPDRDRDELVHLEIESDPLPICTRPPSVAFGAADVMSVYRARGRFQTIPARRGSGAKPSFGNSSPRRGCSRSACAPVGPIRMRQV
jgi:hypothetical protein